MSIDTATRIRGLIKEAHDKRRRHDDLSFTPTLTESERVEQLRQVDYYHGQLLGLHQALNMIEGEWV